MPTKRVTAEVSEELHHKAKVEATKRGLTLSEVVRDALAAFVGGEPARKLKPKGGEPKRETTK